MKKKITYLILVAYMMISAVAVSWAQAPIPPIPANSFYVQDYAGVLSADTRARINTMGSQLAVRTKAQVVVVTIQTLQDTSLNDYALGILRKWGVGDKTLNNGVVVLVAVADKQSRIEVGYGLEGALPDAKTGYIQDQYMVPYFQKGDYDKGILSGYGAIVGEVAKEYNVQLRADSGPIASNNASSSSWWEQIPWWLQILIIIGIAVLGLIDWLFFGGSITYLILALLFRGRGGSGGGGFGGGSGGGGGSNRKW